MQLDPEWLQAQGDDAQLLFWISTAFFPKPPRHIGVAVSGGGDSMALLHLVHRWSEQTRTQISAVSVDHGLRDGSRTEAEGVAQFCAAAGIPHSILTWGGWDGSGNLQAKARAARYQMIAKWAKDKDIDGITLGHTKDDVAETFVMRLSRKAGVDGLSAMDKQWQADDLIWVRPLLFVARDELRAYLRRVGVDWVEDPSNEDPQFERVRVRQAMAGLAELGIDTDALHSAAFNLQMARSALEHYTSEAAQTHVTEAGGSLTLRRMLPLPGEIERRLLSKAVQWVGRRDYPPRSSHLEQLDKALAINDKATVCGCIVIREGRDLRIAREYNAVKDISCPTDAIWDSFWRLNGPHAENLTICALGEDGLKHCPDWRDTGHRRAALLATPAVYQGDTLIAAPVAGLSNGWTAQFVADFASYLAGH